MAQNSEFIPWYSIEVPYGRIVIVKPTATGYQVEPANGRPIQYPYGVIYFHNNDRQMTVASTAQDRMHVVLAVGQRLTNASVHQTSRLSVMINLIIKVSADMVDWSYPVCKSNDRLANNRK